MGSYFRLAKDSIFRRKVFKDSASAYNTELDRCLNLYDVVLIGLGHTLGAGLYVVTGQIVRNVAGPSAIISYALSSLVSLNTALSYAEFSSRIPKAGSAYAYAYTVVGQLLAFLVGWNVILENLIGLSAVSLTASNYVNSLSNGRIDAALDDFFGVTESEVFSRNPNLIALGITIFMAIILSCGVKKSLGMNNILTSTNLLCIVLFVVSCLMKADISNWTLKDHGGFAPFGVQGILSAAGIGVFSFVGFEVIANTAEEMKNPCKLLPKGLLFTLLIVAVSLLLVCGSLSLHTPYYALPKEAAFAEIFNNTKLFWMKYILSIGAIAAMIASTIGSTYACSRILYAMSIDGMLPKLFSKVTSKKIPVFSTLISGAIGGIIACFIKLSLLVELLSIGCLFAFTIVSISLVILRYTPSYRIYLPPMCEQELDNCNQSIKSEDSQSYINEEDAQSLKELQDVLEGTGRLKLKYMSLNRYWLFNQQPTTLVIVNTFLISMATFALGVIIRLSDWKESVAMQVLIAVVIGFICANFSVICMHQQNSDTHYFRIPLVPLIPTLSLVLNIILMVNLSGLTWLRFLVWVILGLIIYFGYSVKNITFRNEDKTIPKTETSALYEQPKAVSVTSIRPLWTNFDDKSYQ